MIPRGNILKMHRALVAAYAIRQTAGSLAHFTRAMKHSVFDNHVHRAWSLGARLVMVSSAVAGAQIQAMNRSSWSDSPVDNEAAEPKEPPSRRDSSRPFRSDTSPSVKTLLGFFSRASRSVTPYSSRKHHVHHDQSTHTDNTGSDPFADLTQNAKCLARDLLVPFAPILNRAFVRASKAISEVRAFLSNTSIISQATKWTVLTIAALIAIGRAATDATYKLIEPLQKVSRVVLGPVSALRWPLTNGILPVGARLTESLATIVRIVAVFGELSLGWYVVIAARLAVAAYDLYRHWNTAKRLRSRSIESAHRAATHLRQWMADKTRKAAAYTGNPIPSVTATMSNALYSFTAASGVLVATTTQSLNSARSVERVVTAARPVPVLCLVRRTAAAAAFAAPLMLTSPPAGAFTTPLVSTDDAARITTPPSASFTTQTPIVIDYAPNVIIHAESAADTAALRRQVMEVLERHGRELHQVLQRKIVRQQRRDFQPRYSNEQG